MYSSPQCISGNYKDCFDFQEIPANQVPTDVTALFSSGQKPDGYLLQTISGNCPTCTSKPYLCVFDKSKDTDTPYKLSYEDNRIATYLGPDGKGFDKLYDLAKNTVGDITTRQCRFERDDWKKWVHV